MNITTEFNWSQWLYPSKESHSSDMSEVETAVENQFKTESRLIFESFADFSLIDAEWGNYIHSLVRILALQLYKNNCFLLPASENNYTCIVTDEEVDLLSKLAFLKFQELFQDSFNYKFNEGGIEQQISETKFLFRELIYCIPVIMHQNGYSLIRKADVEFIQREIVYNIARALHERYKLMWFKLNMENSQFPLQDFNDVLSQDSQQYADKEFEDLPDYIQSSNLDSAFHLGTKLLSIGYMLTRPKYDSDLILLHLSENDFETMAKLEHERWAWRKRLDGFHFGLHRDDSLKLHPCLIPYRELPEMEKVKDRIQVQLYPFLIFDIGLVAKPLNEEQKSKISYFPQFKSELQKVLEELEQLNIKNKLELDQIELIDRTIHKIRSTIEDQKLASLIQLSSFPDKLNIRTSLPNSFLLFKPKDILSGDFYFTYQLKHYTIFAVADCTGHGISGAMLTMLCNQLLYQSIQDKGLMDPSEVLEFVYSQLVITMKRYSKELISDFGMEIALCTFSKLDYSIRFQGINRPLYVFHKGEFEQVSPHKLPTGTGYIDLAGKIGSSHFIQLVPGDTIYLSTDGFADQFGGLDNKKFSNASFKNYLQSIQGLPMLEQMDSLNRTFEQWKNPKIGIRNEQTDDVTVFGVRIE